jgi:hypothetical protein
VEKNHWRAGAACKEAHAHAGVSEVEKGFVNLRSNGVEEAGFGHMDTVFESHELMRFPFT